MLRFGLQVLPLTLLAGLSGALGLWLAPETASPAGQLLAALLAVLLFAALLTFKEAAGWNSGLLLAFFFALGFAVSLFSIGQAAPDWGWAALGAAAVLGAAAGLGRWAGGAWREVGAGLWIVAWAYLLGWAALAFLRLDPLLSLVWAGAGLILFGGLAAAWFAEVRVRPSERNGAALAVELSLFAANLTLAAFVLIRGLRG